MSKHSLEQAFKEVLPLLEKHARKAQTVDEHSVFQPENKEIRLILNSMVEKLLLPGSKMKGKEHVEAFLQKLEAGKKGLILAEHYSNFDLPAILWLMEALGDCGKSLSEKIVAIAGMKLSEDNPYVSALAEGYNRIVIYPSRTLASITDPETLKVQTARSRSINLAAMKALEEKRTQGNAILVFPTGTRYREGKPETKRGLREIDSYIRSADMIMLISVNGNCLRISDNPSNMMGDLVFQDRVITEASPVYDSTDLREQAKKYYSSESDKKQAVADYVMQLLEKMHQTNEVGRL